MPADNPRSLTGLTAAVHTPFHADGSLHLGAVEKQAAHLLENDVPAAFICGTTGESHSLTTEERRLLAQRWAEVTAGSPLRVIVHAGGNCVEDAVHLAAQAQELGVFAVSALAPSYFKPRDISALVECCARVAKAAPDLPFYFYDIPALTGVNFPMPAFLDAAGARIPNLAGIKFTNNDLMSYQLCQEVENGRYDLPWGIDECLLAAVALGARGAVGSSYNFAAPVYQRILAAFETGDMESARREQKNSVLLIWTLAHGGYMAGAKAVMEMLGVPVGPPRLPHQRLTDDQTRSLRIELEQLGFFNWI
jgi:N-acetylneuraminate lyase